MVFSEILLGALAPSIVLLGVIYTQRSTRRSAHEANIAANWSASNEGLQRQLAAVNARVDGQADRIDKLEEDVRKWRRVVDYALAYIRAVVAWNSAGRMEDFPIPPNELNDHL